MIGAVLNSCASIAVLPTRGGGSGWMRRPILQTSGIRQWHVLPWCVRQPTRARATFHFRGHWALRCVLADVFCTCCLLCFHACELDLNSRTRIRADSAPSSTNTSQLSRTPPASPLHRNDPATNAKRLPALTKHDNAKTRRKLAARGSTSTWALRTRAAMRCTPRARVREATVVAAVHSRSNALVLRPTHTLRRPHTPPTKTSTTPHAVTQTHKPQQCTPSSSSPRPSAPPRPSRPRPPPRPRRRSRRCTTRRRSTTCSRSRAS